jgi:hypothetical protein
MISRYLKEYRLIEWRCCGLIWQLIISKLFPKRNVWFPICPECGAEGRSYFEINERRKNGNIL